MKVKSPAGDFEFVVKDSSVEGDFVVLKGQMGVWDSKIYLSPSDIWLFVSIFLRPAVLAFLVKLPFRYLFGPDAKRKEDNED
ncbi:MAG: hypothetical protein HY693_02025 [Deltaproteobacteria bacterium]|nr:hypothetical protein [Deltaproteobacteria bacterium]